jgi:hypothetical protein
LPSATLIPAVAERNRASRRLITGPDTLLRFDI